MHNSFLIKWGGAYDTLNYIYIFPCGQLTDSFLLCCRFKKMTRSIFKQEHDFGIIFLPLFCAYLLFNSYVIFEFL